MRKSILLILLILVVTTIGYSQNDTTKTDSVQMDSLYQMLDKLMNEWNPENEPWNFVEFELTALKLKINYGQQSIHPFLAEYNRKIQFLTENQSTDTLDMSLNWGGRTLIKIYLDSVKSLLIMEDSFGRYFFDLNTFEYSEKLEEFTPYENKEYLGQINGKDYPLVFEPAEK
jgi:hypothetical protein